MATHYAVLGLECGATREEIKKAHRALALRHHPDKAAAKGGDQEVAADKFREIQEAYEVLADEKAKAAYDALQEGGDFAAQEQEQARKRKEEAARAHAQYQAFVLSAKKKHSGLQKEQKEQSLRDKVARARGKEEQEREERTERIKEGREKVEPGREEAEAASEVKDFTSSKEQAVARQREKVLEYKTAREQAAGLRQGPARNP
ncbi:DnaJ domain-containing protein [Baffinella frigidus]|nr:DnaJ domain-containing protein [Cryptophyta sp. CCMP2293]